MEHLPYAALSLLPHKERISFFQKFSFFALTSFRVSSCLDATSVYHHAILKQTPLNPWLPGSWCPIPNLQDLSHSYVTVRVLLLFCVTASFFCQIPHPLFVTNSSACLQLVTTSIPNPSKSLASVPTTRKAHKNHNSIGVMTKSTSRLASAPAEARSLLQASMQLLCRSDIRCVPLTGQW